MTQQINLLDRALLPTRDWCTAPLIVGLAAAIGLGSVVQYTYERTALAQAMAASAHATPEFEDPGDGSALAHPLDAPLAEVRARVAASERLLGAVGGLATLPSDNAPRLRALFAALPESMWLREVVLAADAAVHVSGGALDSASLAAFSARLGREPAYRGLPLQVFTVAPGATAGTGDTAQPEMALPPHYGFTLSSANATAPSPP